MKATAVSSTVSNTGVILMNGMLVPDILIRNLLSKDINRCPAVMFAVRRTHRVIGRMMILTVSTNTMKFISGEGVPWGVMCDRTLLVFFVRPNIRDASHMDRDNGRVIVLCDEIARVWGSMAEMLMITKVKIYVMIIFPVPLFISIRFDDSL